MKYRIKEVNRGAFDPQYKPQQLICGIWCNIGLTIYTDYDTAINTLEKYVINKHILPRYSI